MSEIKNIWQAISVVQQQLPVIDKSSRNDFFKSNYTPLDDVVKRVYPLLEPLSVACSQILEESNEANVVQVRTVLCHWPSETKVESVCRMPAVAGKGMQPQHAYGSSITYARRYALTSILGIVCGDEDDDGGVPHSEPQRQQQPEADHVDILNRTLDKFGCGNEAGKASFCKWLGGGVDKEFRKEGLTVKSLRNPAVAASVMSILLKMKNAGWNGDKIKEAILESLD